MVGDGRLPRSGRRTRYFPGAAHGRAGRRYRRGRRRSGGCRRAISIVKKSDLLTFLSAADPSWKKYPTSGWTVQTNGSAWPDANTALFDGNSSTDIYTWSYPSLEFTIDMKTSQWVAGFDIQAYGNISNIGEYFELSTSEDGGELDAARRASAGRGSQQRLSRNQLCSAAQALQCPLCQVGRHEGQRIFARYLGVVYLRPERITGIRFEC